MERIAVCPGSFDPITKGHLDIIQRASAMFDKVIVVTMVNADKTPFFSTDERVDFIRRCVDDLGLQNVKVDSYDGLLAEYTKSHNAIAIVKGLRAVSDFEYEFQMALLNKKLNPSAETLFFTTSSENLYLSSSMVRSVASLNGDVSNFVPACIYKDIKKRFEKKGV
ncbi:MAG: pantetheine-phosphate adenylyltransferase [Clostridia bacterium]|nr:pantetheine-phosphate adenylyltransferase [Clostridia bacterium]